MYTLFFKPTCPFCQKVLSYVEKHDIALTLKNIQEQDIAEELVHLGGKKQVPFLVHEEGGMKLYESDDIIAYLEKQNTQ